MIPFQSRFRGRVGVLVLALALPPIAVAPASAATLAVTTTVDVIAIDGECSLREAITAANTNQPFNDCPAGDALPTIDTVELPAGTYTLTLLPVDDDANLGGDLDISEPVTVRGLGDDFLWWDDPATPDVETLDVYNDPTGFPRTFTEADLPDVIVEMGLGDPAIPGDGDRIFDILESPSRIQPREGEDVPKYTFENLGVVRGEAFCEVTPPTVFCSAGAGGINSSSPDSLELRRVALFENSVGCSGRRCGGQFNAAALSVLSATELRVTESVIASNRATCAEEDCLAGSIVKHGLKSFDLVSSEIDHVLVVDNVASCSAEDCRVGPVVILETVTQQVQQTVITANESSCSGAGADCSLDDFFELGEFSTPACIDSNCFRIVQDVEISENRISCDGPECNTSELMTAFATFAQTLERLRFRENVQECDGTECDLDEAIDIRALPIFPGTSLDVRTFDFVDNVNRCSGLECDVDTIFQVVGEGFATVSDVTIRGEGQCTGESCGVRSSVLLNRVAAVTNLSVTDTEVTCVGDDCTLSPLVSVTATGADAPILSGIVLTDNDVSCASAGCGFGSGTFNPGHVGEGGVLAFTTSSIPMPLAAMGQSTITGNTTSARGMLASNLDLEIVDSIFSMNASASDGGAIFNGWVPNPEMPSVISPGILTIRGTTLELNEAGQGPAGGRGGGLFNPEGAVLRLVGSSIDNNTATDGGGIWNEGMLTHRQGTTIDGNAPNGCVDAGNGSGCGLLFSDGFESGDTSGWTNTVQ
ncbi:MAG: CSLREA domain-containing protein [Acidobacteriota bacterium]